MSINSPVGQLTFTVDLPRLARRPGDHELLFSNDDYIIETWKLTTFACLWSSGNAQYMFQFKYSIILLVRQSTISIQPLVQ